MECKRIPSAEIDCTSLDKIIDNEYPLWTRNYLTLQDMSIETIEHQQLVGESQFLGNAGKELTEKFWARGCMIGFFYNNIFRVVMWDRKAEYWFSEHMEGVIRTETFKRR